MPVTINGVTYDTTEHYFQAMKFISSNATSRDLEYARLIAGQNTPNKAKVLASQQIKGGYKWRTDLNPIIQEYQDVHIRNDWDFVKYNVMRAAVMNKFLQNPQLLLQTGDAYIAEASPKDYIWGIGKDGTGRNMLGIILMETRYVLRGQIKDNIIIPGVLAISNTPDGNSQAITQIVQNIGQGIPVTILNDSNTRNVIVELFQQLYQISYQTADMLVNNYRQ